MKTERKRNLKGSVLFTVVSVLAIMIIFMTCTLAMSAAANKRARKTYSSSQSSYTARTAIDSILAAVGTDKNFSKAIRELTNEGDYMDVVVEINNPSMGSINNAKITYAGTKQVFDPDTKVNAWVERNLYTITADVTIGGETTTITSNVLQDPTTPPGNSGTGAAFLTYGSGLDVANHVGLFGGSYIGMGEWDTKAANGIITNWQSNLQYNEWNPALEQMVVLTDKGYLTHKTYNLQNQSTMEAPAVVNGNISMANSALTYIYNYRGSGINNPGVQIWGDLTTKAGGVIRLVTSDYVKKELEKGYDFFDMPYMFVDGKIEGPKLQIGNDQVPLNIFCDNIVETEQDCNVYADIYCMDREKTSVFNGNKSLLLKWSSSVFNKTPSYSTMGGNFYSKGDVVIKNTTAFDGDVKIEGNLTVNADISVEGELVVGGKIIKNGGNITAKKGIVADKVVKSVVDDSVKDKYEEFIENQINFNITYDKNQYEKPTISCYAYESSIADIEKAGGFKFNKSGDNYSVTETISDSQWNSIQPYINQYSPLPDRKMYKEKEHPENVISEDEYNKLVLKDADLNDHGLTLKSLTSEGYKVTDKNKKAKEIYPSRAEKETLMGIHWPVKGIEHRVTTVSATTDDGQVNPVIAEIESKTYHNNTLSNTIEASCTLEGEFTKEVKVRSGEKDIYVKLKNVNFNCTDLERNGAFISVEETGDGKVYFVLEGEVKSNYDYSKEDSGTKLIKTVYDWMNDFSLEDNDRAPETTPIDVENGDIDAALAKAKNEGNLHIQIKNETFNNDLHIPAPENESDELWVTLDGVSFQASKKLVVDDVGKEHKGKVNFYIKNKCYFNGSSATLPSGIITQSFIDIQSQDEIYIFGNNSLKSAFPKANEKNTYKAPRVYVYGDDKSEIHGKDHVYFTAYVHAIKTTYDVPVAWEIPEVVDKIIYNGYKLSEMRKLTGLSGLNRIGAIGMLDVSGAYFQNDTLTLYVDGSDNGVQTVVDAEGRHTYASVEYTAYAN